MPDSARGGRNVSEPLRAKALRCLSRREYSRLELRRKLAPMTEEASELEILLDGLMAQGLLSDARYAESRVGARAGRYGNLRLKQELRQAGVDDEAIAAALPEPDEEARRCRIVWEKKFGALPTSPQDAARQFNFLCYRGFSQEAIRKTLDGRNEG
jgi:regulatory protein